MVTAANGYFMNEIQNKIESLGYYMTCSILNSKNYGVPQSRERAFILAYRHKTLSLHFLKQIPRLLLDKQYLI